MAHAEHAAGPRHRGGAGRRVGVDRHGRDGAIARVRAVSRASRVEAGLKVAASVAAGGITPERLVLKPLEADLEQADAARDGAAGWRVGVIEQAVAAAGPARRVPRADDLVALALQRGVDLRRIGGLFRGVDGGAQRRTVDGLRRCGPRRQRQGDQQGEGRGGGATRSGAGHGAKA